MDISLGERFFFIHDKVKFTEFLDFSMKIEN
jgi:hypothetical protein